MQWNNLGIRGFWYIKDSKITYILNEIYDTEYKYLKSMLMSIFIALLKIPGASKCEVPRTISIMSHILTLFLMIVMVKVPQRMITKNC